LTDHDAAENLCVATDRGATPPRVHATLPGQYGLEFVPGVFGSGRPTFRLFSAVLHRGIRPDELFALPVGLVLVTDAAEPRHRPPDGNPVSRLDVAVPDGLGRPARYLRL
jgi:hypothetical protein